MKAPQHPQTGNLHFSQTITTLMKFNKFLLLTLFATGLLTACGGGETESSGDLVSKKAELKLLKDERKALNQKITALEAEVGSLDPTPAQDTRIPVQVSELKPSTFQHFIKVQGQVEADNNVMVSAKMPGIIQKVYVTEGQRVGKGTLLAKLDDAILQKSMLELETQLDLATALFNKQKNLWDQKIGSEVQFLQAQTQKEGLERRINTTKEQISQMRIVSPISGVVDRAIAKAGEAASPGIPAFNVINLNKLSFKANVSESYIPYVKRGDQVSIYFASIDKTIDAKITTVSQTINPVNRTVGVEVKIGSAGADLKANMTGEMSINDVTHESTIVVPLKYVQRRGNEEYVMIAQRSEDGKVMATRKVVDTGLSYGENIEVETGLKPGQMLIVEGIAGLSDGAEITFQGAEQ